MKKAAAKPPFSCPPGGRIDPSEVLALCGQVWYLTGRKISGIAGAISTVPDLCKSPV
jgi:hypothetical protein